MTWKNEKLHGYSVILQIENIEKDFLEKFWLAFWKTKELKNQRNNLKKGEVSKH